MAGAPWTDDQSPSSSWNTQEISQPRSEPSLRLLRFSEAEIAAAPRARAIRLKTAEWPAYGSTPATSTGSATTSQTFAPTSPPSVARGLSTAPLGTPSSAICGTPCATMSSRSSALLQKTSARSTRSDERSNWALIAVAVALLVAGLASNAVRHTHGGSDTTRGDAHDTATASVAAGGR